MEEEFLICEHFIIVQAKSRAEPLISLLVSKSEVIKI